MAPNIGRFLPRSPCFRTTVHRASVNIVETSPPLPPPPHPALPCLLYPNSEKLSLSIPFSFRYWWSWPYNSFSEAQASLTSGVLFTNPHCRSSGFLSSSPLPQASCAVVFLSNSNRVVLKLPPMSISHFFYLCKTRNPQMGTPVSSNRFMFSMLDPWLVVFWCYFGRLWLLYEVGSGW